MKKTSIVVKEKDSFEIKILINNTAYIKSVTGETGLLNIKNNKIIGKMDNYYTIYDNDDEFYYQEKKIKDPNVDSSKIKKTVRIYDAKNEKMLVDGWEVVKTFSNYYLLTAVKSPVDGKIHLFDQFACRKPNDIFDIALDDVEVFYNDSTDIYLTITTTNGKKGIYHHNCSTPSLITSIEFDNIQKFPNIIVYTKNNQKYFICDGKNGKMSLEFDEIVLDKKRENIVYCKKSSRTYVYNTNLQELLLNEECDDIKYLCFWDGYIVDEQKHDKYYFVITKNNLKGLLEVETIYNAYDNCEVITSKTSLLPADYDDIEYSYDVFYLEKDGKIGLFKRCGKNNIFVEANYDEIIFLSNSAYALCYGDRCDVYNINTKLDRLIKNCKLVSKQRHGTDGTGGYNGFIFEQNNSYGILHLGLHWENENVIVDNYDNVNYLGNGYYEVEKNGKKGVHFRSRDIIPIKYDNIDFKIYTKGCFDETAYFALEKKGSGFKLAKKRHWLHNDDDKLFMSTKNFKEINLFEDIVTLRTKENLLIYDYEENLLKKLPASSQISIYKKSDSSDDKEPIYVIDGKLYYHKVRKFEEVFVKENNLYITTYETETDSFEIKTFNKTEHDSFCKIIDSQEDSVAEQSLIDIFENNGNEVRQQYHTLVLKRTPKNN